MNNHPTIFEKDKSTLTITQPTPTRNPATHLPAPSLKDLLNTKSRAYNAGVGDFKGLGGRCDMGVGDSALSIQPFSFFEQVEQAETLYYGDWQSQKIINIPVSDSYREGWTYEGLSAEEVDAVELEFKRLRILETFQQAGRLERLHGGSAIYIGLADYAQDAAEPVDFINIGLGDLKFLNLVRRTEISKIAIQNSPLEPDFGYPTHYWVWGQKVHVSRLIFFNGNPLSPVRAVTYRNNSSYRNDGMGYPILMTLYTDLLNSTKSRQIAAHLMERASTIIVGADTQTMDASAAGQQNKIKLQTMAQEMNNYRVAMISNSPNQKVTIDTLPINFGAIPELIKTYLDTLVAGSDIAKSRFLGTSPSGIGGNDERELETYYTRIAANQVNHVKPALLQMFDILLPNIGIPLNDEFGIQFNPLWSQNERESAETRAININNMMTLRDAMVIGSEEALAELKMREVFLDEPESVPAALGNGGFLTDGGEADPESNLADLKRTLDNDPDRGLTPNA